MEKTTNDAVKVTTEIIPETGSVYMITTSRYDDGLIIVSIGRKYFEGTYEYYEQIKSITEREKTGE